MPKFLRVFAIGCVAANLACWAVAAAGAGSSNPPAESGQGFPGVSTGVSPGAARGDSPRASFEENLDAIFNRHAYAEKGVQLAWQNGGDVYTIVEPSASGNGKDIVAYETESGRRSVLISAAQLTPPGAKEPLGIDAYAWSLDKKKLLIFTNTRKVWRQNTRGDYWVLDEGTMTLKKLGGNAPESTLMFATFAPDSSKVAYVRANNLYAEALDTGKITQLTSDGSAEIINGTSDWVSEEELGLRNCFRWSPDSQWIAYWQFDQTGVGEYTLTNDTSGEYPVTFKYQYPQPGTTNSAVRVGVLAAGGGTTRWISLPGDARQHYIARMEWAGNSSEVLIEYLDRMQQTNQLMLANAGTGESRLFFEDRDKAWVDFVPLDWIGKANASEPDLLYLSERDGWKHAYRVDRTTGKARLITNFEGDVLEKAGIDQEGGWLYFLASPENATQSFLYRSRLDGQGTPERVSPAGEPGYHQYDVSPNGRWAIHAYSTMARPPVFEVVSLPGHKVLRTLEDNHELAEKAKALLPNAPEFLKVTVANGATLDGYMLKPPDFDPARKYPVLVYVYGEPADQTVVDRWSPPRVLFHALVAREGYLVISFDNQGTPAPKGREWRKCVYGTLGVLSSAQQVQAIEALAHERRYIDTSRMAIWGWSGGGSNTLNVMFRYPGVFSTGISVAPVADQRHYDTIYQERFMGRPETNEQGYHDGSPINFAQGLAGHLLVVHGSGDDNVHFQGTELLINKLVELGKPFGFMEYPNRTHSISEGAGTSFHVYSLIARYLEEHVPPGGVAQ